MLLDRLRHAQQLAGAALTTARSAHRCGGPTAFPRRANALAGVAVNASDLPSRPDAAQESAGCGLYQEALARSRHGEYVLFPRAPRPLAGNTTAGATRGAEHDFTSRPP